MITKTWSLTVFLCLHGSKQLWEEVPEQVEMSTPNSKGFPPKNMQGFFWWMKHELKWVKYICDMSIWSYGLTHQFHSYWLVLCSSEKWTPWIITRLLATNLVIRLVIEVQHPQWKHHLLKPHAHRPHGLLLAEKTV